MPIDENERIIPGSPYGESKNILERMLYWLDRTQGMRYACLRYFNACGASEAVSYTHLDVYKRQPSTSSNSLEIMMIATPRSARSFISL